MHARAGGIGRGFAQEKRHGLLFDGAVFVSGALGAWFVADNARAWSEPFIGFLLLLALATQIAGALLKKGPLSRRLALRERREGRDLLDRLMDALLFLHFILFTVVAIMALSLLGIAPAEPGDGWVALGLGIAAAATIVVWRAGKPGGSASAMAGGTAGREYLADGLLWLSASILTQTFWVMLASDVGAAAGIGLNGRAVVLLLALSLLFVVFYLPARYLFLVEDYRSPLTWLQMWMAMVPVARMVLVG